MHELIIRIPEDLHPDTIALIQESTERIALKLSRNQHKYGWSNEWLTQDWQDACALGMQDHIVKGDPRDVAIYAFFMMRRGWNTLHVLPGVDVIADLRAKLAEAKALIEILKDPFKQ